MTRHENEVPAGAVVVGIDRAPSATRVLDWAADEAAAQGRPLVVVHTTGQARVAEAVERVVLRLPALAPVPVLAMTEPFLELLRLSHSAHLVVMGSRARRIVAAHPASQLATWLARRSACPLVTVPAFDARTARQGVLAGVSAGPEAEAVLDFAAEHACARGVPLSVVHAAAGTTASESDRRSWLAEAMGGVADRFPDVRIGTVLLPGRPVPTMLRMADRMHLLVVGRQQATGLHRAPFRHVHGSVADRSPCPAAVVPARVAEPV